MVLGMEYDICVTLVNTGEKKEITHTLKTLFDNTARCGLKVGVAIVDNASGDGVKELESIFPNTKVFVQNKNNGFGAGHNRACQMFDADYYFILNPDTEFFGDSCVLEKMYKFMEENPRVGVLGPKIVYPNGDLQYSCYRFPVFTQPFFRRTIWGQSGKGKKLNDHFLMKDFSHEEVRPVDWLMGSALFIRGRAFKEVGGFDERYWMYAEDSDLCRQLWERHWAVYYYPEVCIRHVHGRASSKVPGIIRALLTNRFARVHLISWLKYFWKWRGNHKYYR